MTDILARLTAALADRYTIEREVGAGGELRLIRELWVMDTGLWEQLMQGLAEAEAVAAQHGAVGD